MNDRRRQDAGAAAAPDVPLHPDFAAGRADFRRGDLAAALRSFQSACQATAETHVHAPLYLSCLGLTQVLLNNGGGLTLCRRAAAEEARRGEVFENLARAELRLGHRRQAFDAVRRGLRLDGANPELLALREEMGVRRPPVLKFLDRDNPLNRILGKLTYRVRRAVPARH